MKLELLVIAGQLNCGEYVLKSCTHNKSAQQLNFLNGLNPFLYYLLKILERSQKEFGRLGYRKIPAGGPATKSSPIKTDIRPPGVSEGRIEIKNLVGMFRIAIIITQGDPKKTEVIAS